LSRAEKVNQIQEAILTIFLQYKFDKNMSYLSLKLLTEKFEEDFPELLTCWKLMKDGTE
jgi:hypothetical protein